MRGPKVKAEVQELLRLPDKIGSYDESWEVVTTLTGVLSSKGYERLIGADKERVYISHIFVTDYKSGVTTNHRLKVDDRYFDIKFVERPLFTKRYMVLHLEEILDVT